jgi:RNA polymerase sigma-70 factor (ECF subfamily)
MIATTALTPNAGLIMKWSLPKSAFKSERLTKRKRREDAFMAALNDHPGIIHDICREYAHPSEPWKDLSQEIIIQLWKAFPRFRGESKVSTWMHIVAKNAAINRLNKNQKMKIEFMPSPPEVAESYDLHHLPDSDEVMEIIHELDKEDKGILKLFLQKFTWKEISKRVGLTESAIYKRLQRLKEKYRNSRKSKVKAELMTGKTATSK